MTTTAEDAVFTSKLATTTARPCGQERLRAIVKQAIDQADPIGLLAIGCPNDEYDPEIKQVLTYVAAYADPASLGQRIHQTFVKMFDERITGPPEVYQRIAQQILKGLGG